MNFSVSGFIYIDSCVSLEIVYWFDRHESIRHTVLSHSMDVGMGLNQILHIDVVFG